MAQIELAAPRVIVIEERGQTYRLKTDRIPKQRWLKYFEGIVSTSENQGGKRIDSFDSMTARVELAEKSLMDAEGYATADGQPIAQTPGWQQLIPMRHRQALGNALAAVERGDVDEEGPIIIGSEAVYLSAVWSADESGKMLKYSGLCHRFRTPSAEHQRRYSRDINRSVIVGGSRKGITKWLGAQPTLMELYDELIRGVEGYTANGQELETSDAIAREMDAYHKVVAASALFEAADPNVSDEAK